MVVQVRPRSIRFPTSILYTHCIPYHVCDAHGAKRRRAKVIARIAVVEIDRCSAQKQMKIYHT